MEIPKTRYATRSDGVSIAYQVLGDGPLNLVFCAGFVSHLDLAWTNPGITHFFRRLASFSRLALYDKAGTGVSDPISHVPTLEERVDEIRTVMDAAGMEQAALLGESEGGPAAILFAATHPARTGSLVLYGSVVKGVPTDSEVADFGLSAPEAIEAKWAALESVLEDWGQGGTIDLLAPSIAANRAARLGFATFERAAVSPSMARGLVASYRQIDITAVLPTISVPTLVLHRHDDWIDVGGGRYLASHIPGARFVELDGTDHSYFTQDSEAILDEIERFLTGGRAARTPDRVLATVLFTDIVDSTSRAAELGDARWRDLLERHDALIRERVDAADGRVIKSLGDGVFATIPGPARAVRCADDVIRASESLGLRLRAGVHTGECEALGDDLGGLAVHIGARVAAHAAPGDVLVSSTVKDLVTGSGLRFDDRGAHELKGVPGSWQLYALAGGDAGSQPVDAADAHMTVADRATVRLARRAPGVLRTIGRLTVRERP